MLICAFCLEGLGEIALKQERVEWAVLLLGAADAIRSINGKQCPIYIAQTTFEQTLATARTRLGESTFTTLWNEGRAMTPEQALATEHRAYNALPIPNETSSRLTPMTVAHEMQDAPSEPDILLTKCEVDVLRLLAWGLTNNQIASELSISPHTVNAHIKAIYSKLGVTSRSGATSYAIKQHLI